jgi:hypothetical protein
MGGQPGAVVMLGHYLRKRSSSAALQPAAIRVSSQFANQERRTWRYARMFQHPKATAVHGAAARALIIKALSELRPVDPSPPRPPHG